MISEEIKLLVDELQEQGKMNFVAAATEDSINEFEEVNNVKLPGKYKDWLLFSDGGELFLPAGVQLYGVGHMPTIDVDDNDRPSNDYIVIGALASGDPILCEKTGDKIAIYNHEAGRLEDDEIYSDFITFLNDLHNILGIGD